MKTYPSILTLTALVLLAVLPLRGADMTRYDARGGSKMRIEGTSTAHDWQAQSRLVIGFLEVGPGFPTEPGQTVSPGKVEARGEVRVPVNSLISVKENGTPYEAKMDNTMYGLLRQTNNPVIVYRVSELTLKEVPKTKEGPYIFDSNGELAVAGVTNKLSMPVNVFTAADKTLKITGTAPLKMTDFKIQPASILGGLFKVGDDIKIKFEWMVGQKKPAAAAAK